MTGFGYVYYSVRDLLTQKACYLLYDIYGPSSYFAMYKGFIINQKTKQPFVQFRFSNSLQKVYLKIPCLKPTCSPLKMDGWNPSFLSEPGLFSGAECLLVLGSVRCQNGWSVLQVDVFQSDLKPWQFSLNVCSKLSIQIPARPQHVIFHFTIVGF